MPYVSFLYIFSILTYTFNKRRFYSSENRKISVPSLLKKSFNTILISKKNEFNTHNYFINNIRIENNLFHQLNKYNTNSNYQQFSGRTYNRSDYIVKTKEVHLGLWMDIWGNLYLDSSPRGCWQFCNSRSAIQIYIWSGWIFLWNVSIIVGEICDKIYTW